MSELAYMTRADWGQCGTGMETSSRKIRNWLGPGPYLFAVEDPRECQPGIDNADYEAAEFIEPGSAGQRVISIQELASLPQSGGHVLPATCVIHPYSSETRQALKRAAASGSMPRAFVMTWTPEDPSRHWLDGMGATNLHDDSTASPDPLLVAAAKLLAGEQYNGLASGNGKAAVVQLVRAFQAEGHSLEDREWLPAFFAAGGDFPHAESIHRLLAEMRAGTRHRVKARYSDNIVDVLRQRLSD